MALDKRDAFVVLGRETTAARETKGRQPVAGMIAHEAEATAAGDCETVTRLQGPQDQFRCGKTPQWICSYGRLGSGEHGLVAYYWPGSTCKEQSSTRQTKRKDETRTLCIIGEKAQAPPVISLSAGSPTLQSRIWSHDAAISSVPETAWARARVVIGRLRH